MQVEEAVELWHGTKDRRVSLFAKAKRSGGKSIPSLFRIPEAEDEVAHSFLTEDESAGGRSEPDPVNCICHLFGLARTAGRRINLLASCMT